jgi:hypothetical protein
MGKITREQTEAAIQAAENAINSEGHLSWVRESAELERAYFSGLFIGLSKISDFNDIKIPMLQMMINTSFGKAGDLTFLDEVIHNNLNKIHSALHDNEWQTQCLATTEKFEAELDGMAERLNFSFRSAKDILIRIKGLACSLPNSEHQPDPDPRRGVQGLLEELKMALGFF